MPLSFAEGVDLPDVGGCNQHGGEKLTANGAAERVQGPPNVAFNGGELGRWYNGDVRIDFSGQLAGFSQSWDRDPGGDGPQFKDAGSGYVQLTWAGEGLHTLYVRAWGGDGNQILATYGPFGYDTTPPQPPASIAPVEVQSGAPFKLQWQAAGDNGSGIAGYRVYIGPQADGTDEWFTPRRQVEAPPLAPGSYLAARPADRLRGQRRRAGRRSGRSRASSQNQEQRTLENQEHRGHEP